jgi:hypothetical protein
MDYLSRRDLSALRMMVGRSPIRYQSGATISSSSNPSIVEGLSGCSWAMDELELQLNFNFSVDMTQS